MRKLTPKKFKRLINLYPPYLGAGVKVDYVSEDWKSIRVSMKLRWYNRNAVGTHFGGNLYTMVDPHLMLMLMQLLGKNYIVWDKSAKIEFVKATTNKVFAEISISDEEVEKIKSDVEKNKKCFWQKTIDIKDEEGELIAKVDKVLYIRKKNKPSQFPVRILSL